MCIVMVTTGCLFPSDPTTQSQLIGLGYSADGDRTLYFTNCSDVTYAVRVEVGTGSEIGTNSVLTAGARDYRHGERVFNLDNPGDSWNVDGRVPPGVMPIWVRVSMVDARNTSDGVFDAIASYPMVMSAKSGSPKRGVTAEIGIEEFESRPCQSSGQPLPSTS